MSHVTAIDINVKDINALKDTCAELGLQFMEGQKTYRWYGKWLNDYSAKDAAFNHGIDPSEYGHGEHAIRVPGSNYDIGVHKNKNGEGYILAYDFWGTGSAIKQKLGEGGGKLKQLYALNTAARAAKQKGLITKRVAGKNGAVKLQILGIK